MMAEIIEGNFRQPSDRNAEAIAKEQRTLDMLTEAVAALRLRAVREGRAVALAGRE